MGGGMFDVGVYPLTVSLYLFGYDIQKMNKMMIVIQYFIPFLGHSLIIHGVFSHVGL